MSKNWGRVHIVRLGNYLMTYEDVTPNLQIYMWLIPDTEMFFSVYFFIRQR